jgi:hypothetical protein
MERRKTENRRQVHLYVADDRRTGPFDRRGDDIRRRERMQEREKIERIRAFKEKDTSTPTDTPTMTKKRLVFACLVLLVIVAALMLLQ